MTNENLSDPRLQGAQAAARAGEFDSAEQLLHEILTQDPFSVLALDLLGFVQYFQGRPEAAELACRRALAIDPNRAYSNKGLGLCLAKQGKLDEGLPYLRHAIALEPGWFDPRWDMAVVLCEAERYREALEVLALAELAIPAETKRLTQLRNEVVARASRSSR